MWLFGLIRVISFGLLALIVMAGIISTSSMIVLGASAEPTGAWSTVAEAGPAGCTTASLAGSFGYTFTGAAYFGPDGMPLPGGAKVDIVAVGIIVYDGQGNFGGNDAISRAGSIQPRSFTGTYTINADCTGTSTIDLATGAVHTFFVVTDGGTEFRIIVTDPGSLLTGIAHKQ